MGPVASQEFEGREDKMGERRGDMPRRGRGTPSSMWSLVTRVTRGEEESREVRDNWEEERRSGREEEVFGKVDRIAGNIFRSTILFGGFNGMDLKTGTKESESGSV